MIEEYLKNIRTISNEAWNIFKSHLTTEDKPDEWWDEIHNGFGELLRRYTDTPYYNYGYALYDLYTKEIGKVIRGEYDSSLSV